MMTIMFVSFFAFLGVMAICGSGDSQVDIAKEKTKQLVLQYKLDSLKSIHELKNTIK